GAVQFGKPDRVQTVSLGCLDLGERLVEGGAFATVADRREFHEAAEFHPWTSRELLRHHCEADRPAQATRCPVSNAGRGWEPFCRLTLMAIDRQRRGLRCVSSGLRYRPSLPPGL